ncbi:hypothetical protein RND71_017002 [Anisodus tanguticus]|uniref:Uncharacterized protein n=1 Tax=Anisodus tanguticus TaxID=243964 RepID=A0AAE1S3B3_9SOLA|nr:hypothetical protein RND71_017002 [Anisodus tanguticus]
MKALLPYKILIPYFLEKSKFNSKRGIGKSQSDALKINLIDNLPQQANREILKLWRRTFLKSLIAINRIGNDESHSERRFPHNRCQEGARRDVRDG